LNERIRPPKHARQPPKKIPSASTVSLLIPTVPVVASPTPITKAAQDCIAKAVHLIDSISPCTTGNDSGFFVDENMPAEERYLCWTRLGRTLALDPLLSDSRRQLCGIVDIATRMSSRRQPQRTGRASKAGTASGNGQ
jgi:hypothetical protein